MGLFLPDHMLRGLWSGATDSRDWNMRERGKRRRRAKDRARRKATRAFKQRMRRAGR